MKNPPLRKKPGRKPGNKLPIDPSKFEPYTVRKTPEAAKPAILERISEGESLREICRTPGFPSTSTVYDWLRDPNQRDFADRYERAREARAELLAEQIVEIVDNVEEDPASRRVRMDARKWIAARLHPKRYGEKATVDHGGRVDHIHSTQAQRDAALAAMDDPDEDD